MGYKPIKSCGVIGDLHTVALASIDGSIDLVLRLTRTLLSGMYICLCCAALGSRCGTTPSGRRGSPRRRSASQSAAWRLYDELPTTGN
jgi:hypothetical protein